MAVAALTRQGLTSMAMSVILLWGCILGERAIVRQAIAEQARALRTIESLRNRRDEPVSTPVPRIPHPLHPIAG